jgi:hypothetical protein
MLGGYQVIKKWLSYREHAVLGRARMPGEAIYVSAMAAVQGPYHLLFSQLSF